MKRLILLVLLTIFSQASFAAKPISLSGRVQGTNNLPIESTLVLYKITASNSADCVIYQETHQLDMSGSNGYFKLSFFTGSPLYNLNGTDIFSAKTYACQNGASWIASQNDIRKLAVSVKVDNEPWVDFSSDVINSIAYANEAETLKGKAPADFIQSSVVSTQVKFDQLMAQQPSIMDLVNGTNSTYAKQNLVDSALSNKQNILSYTPINPANNLSELTNTAAARSNLGLGSLATKSAIVDADVANISWSKIVGSPSNFTPGPHVHAISDVTNLATTLNGKIDKIAFTCSSSQVLQYVSVSDSFSCVDIAIGGDLSGSLSASVVSKLQGKTLNVPSPQDQDFLSYNGPSNRWENKSFSGININTIGDLNGGNIIAKKQIYGATVNAASNTSVIDFINGNIVVASNSCSATIDLENLRDGGTYTFVNTNTGTAQCNFTATTIPGAIVKYSPANAARTASVISVYAILRAGNYILISWSSGFE